MSLDITLDTLVKHRHLLPFINKEQFKNIRKRGDSQIEKTLKSIDFESIRPADIATPPDIDETKSKFQRMFTSVGKSTKKLFRQSELKQKTHNHKMNSPGWLTKDETKTTTRPL